MDLRELVAAALTEDIGPRDVTAEATVAAGTRARDGDRLGKGTVIGTLSGDARGMLSAERVALNFVQQASAVATLTRRFVDAVSGTKARIRDTRKTVPLLRALQKQAVTLGGGEAHRSGLAGRR